MNVHEQGVSAQLEPAWALGRVSAAARAESAAHSWVPFTRAAQSRVTDVRHR